MSKLIRCVFDADLRSGHNGLTKIAKKLKVPNIQDLPSGEFVIFVNTKKTMLKMYAPGNVIAHYRTRDNRVMDVRTLALIPKYFNGSEIQYDNALKEMINNKFGVKK